MRKYSYTTLLLLLYTIVFLTTVTADENGGSGYSRFGVGDILYFSTARAMGMGGASIAVLSPSSIDRMNPAAWGSLNRTRFTIGAMYEGYSTTDDIHSAYLSKTRFNGFMVAVPLSVEHGLVFGAGISPYSRVNYNIVTPLTQSGLDYTVQYLGEGGLSQAQAGLSAKLGNDFFFGSKFNYYFGTIRHTINQTFTSTTYTTAQAYNSTQLNGIGATFGTVYTGLRNLFNMSEQNALNVGFVVSTTSYLTTHEERIQTYNLTAVTSHDTLSLPDGTMRIPFSVGAGLSYLSDKFIIAGDVSYQHWNQFTVDGSAQDEIRDSYRFSAGTEILPKREAAAPFTQRVAYRFGMYYDESYYLIKDQPINELGITCGFGLPILGDTRLGIAAEYGFRGTTNLGLQKDRILRISFTFSVSELWFIRPDEE